MASITDPAASIFISCWPPTRIKAEAGPGRLCGGAGTGDPLRPVRPGRHLPLGGSRGPGGGAAAWDHTGR
ncbi:hypothetical protein ACIQU8_22320 [Streptomyces griseus]|uniref:hypothetical protein n=1 Tax=Streptomyces griseus TaxID=1911 RepID=UPI0037F162BE